MAPAKDRNRGHPPSAERTRYASDHSNKLAAAQKDLDRAIATSADRGSAAANTRTPPPAAAARACQDSLALQASLDRTCACG